MRLLVNGHDEYTVAEGDGPVNALDGALRKALRRHYPAVDKLHLEDYKVRVVNARAETAAKVRVAITLPRRDPQLRHRGREHQYHRGLLAGAGRRHRIQTRARSRSCLQVGLQAA